MRTAAAEKLQNRQKVRYGVVGLGYISQIAVLPAFANAKKHCELTALVSDDPVKLKKLGRKYGAEHLYSYEQYDDMLHEGVVDAVYIALPNHMHHEYTIRAARAGIHVLCEKPMAVTEHECREMIQACEEKNVRLMIAYRLHFEESNLKAVELLRSGKIGEPRFFESVFSMQVRDENIRVRREMGGGTLYDIGIYCINAARYLFQDEPTEVVAFSESGPDERFREVDEMTSGILRFPGNRLASFTSSFGVTDISTYRVAGTVGELRMEQAYELAGDIRQQVTLKGRTREKVFPQRDQFAPELIYFADCVRSGEDPEPSGWEGLADVRIIRALYESALSGNPIQLGPFEKHTRPDLSCEIHRPAISEPRLIHAETPTRE